MLDYLLIMRHAKSSWAAPSQTDHERPLNARGQRASRDVASALTKMSIIPELIWSSDAVRTRETATLLIRHLPRAQRVEYFHDFYHAGLNKVLTVCRQKGEPQTKSLVLLGHNPGWSAIASHFAKRTIHMPTGACVILRRDETAETDWLSPDSWRLEDYIKPRDLE